MGLAEISRVPEKPQCTAKYSGVEEEVSLDNLTDAEEEELFEKMEACLHAKLVIPVPINPMLNKNKINMNIKPTSQIQLSTMKNKLQKSNWQGPLKLN